MIVCCNRWYNEVDDGFRLDVELADVLDSYAQELALAVIHADESALRHQFEIFL